MPTRGFCGKWTRDKLNRLRKYLGAYTKIMAGTSFRYAYIDAFARTGYLPTGTDEPLLFPNLSGGDAAEYRAGSARIVLEVSPGFDRDSSLQSIPTICRCLQDGRSLG